MVKTRSNTAFNTAFKDRALKIYPALANLNITDQHWNSIAEKFKNLGRKNLTESFLNISLANAMNISYDELTSQLKAAQQPLRHVKTKQLETAAASSYRPKRRSRGIAESLEPSTCVLNDTKVPAALEKTGVRARPLLPATPNSKVPYDRFKSPGDTRYRKMITSQGITLFSKATPKKQRVNFESSSREAGLKKLIHLCHQVKDLHFTVTKDDIEARKGKKRPCSQKVVMGASCREIFIHSGDKMASEMRGIDFHWAHLFGLALGGNHDPENLIPGSASSNYDTLHIVEEFIVKELYEGNCSAIKCKATPYYSGESLIPDRLVFELEWTNTRGTLRKESTEIHPRSHKGTSKSDLAAIQALRKYVDELNELDDDENNNDKQSNENQAGLKN